MNRSLDPQWLRPAAPRAGTPTPSEAGTSLGASLPHESAHLHVAGAAPYVDDLPELAGTLHAALGLSPVAHGRLVAIDRERIAAMPGVIAVLVADVEDRGTQTWPPVPAGAVTWRWNWPAVSLAHLTTSDPPAVGTWPWAQVRVPACGLTRQLE